MQAIQLAMLPVQTYHKMQQVFSMYEEGKLKGQKQRKMSQANIILLDTLINGSISTKEAFVAAKETKETSAVREQLQLCFSMPTS